MSRFLIILVVFLAVGASPVSASCDISAPDISAPCCSTSGMTWSAGETCFCFWLCGNSAICRCRCAGGLFGGFTPIVSLAIARDASAGVRLGEALTLEEVASEISYDSNWEFSVDTDVRSYPVFADTWTGTFEEVLLELGDDVGVAVTIDTTLNRTTFSQETRYGRM